MKKFIVSVVLIGAFSFFHMKNDKRPTAENKVADDALTNSATDSGSQKFPGGSEKQVGSAVKSSSEKQLTEAEVKAEAAFSDMRMTDGFQLVRHLEELQKQPAAERAQTLSSHFYSNKENRGKVLWFSSRTADVAYLPVWEDVLTRKTPLFGERDKELVRQDYHDQSELSQIIDEQISALMGLEQIAHNQTAKNLIERVILNHGMSVHQSAREFAANRQLELNPTSWLKFSAQLSANDPLRQSLRMRAQAALK